MRLARSRSDETLDSDLLFGGGASDCIGIHAEAANVLTSAELPNTQRCVSRVAATVRASAMSPKPAQQPINPPNPRTRRVRYLTPGMRIRRPQRPLSHVS